ncbi:high mobility group B protein 7 isoform X2 [Manihot esculenta]|uniref:HMG box domain-containing protein n=1 Tax=Manihot esculenta TaxID=3983 RepID=A0A2C9W316_MANES|nr:high mobility group B protein 7 isoform X2 [Manihot esculenta]
MTKQEARFQGAKSKFSRPIFPLFAPTYSSSSSSLTSPHPPPLYRLSNYTQHKTQMARKRVEAEPATATSMVRGKDGSAFARCEECKKDVPVALISMHCCSLEARIKMNLEAQVVEKPAEVKKKPAERKKATSREPKAKKAKKEKSNNPNKPKRPPTAFFIFMDEFRKAFKEANPDNRDVKKVSKEAGEKWKSMTDEEKKPYVDKAAELKAEYDKALESNNVENDDEGGSEKEGAEQEVQEVSDED